VKTYEGFLRQQKDHVFQLSKLKPEWWWYYPTPSKGWGRGKIPWRSNSRATPQGLDQRSKMESSAEDGAPERLGYGTVKEEMSQILQRVPQALHEEFSFLFI